MSVKLFLKKHGIGKIYSFFLLVYDSITCKRVEFSIGDVMLERTEPYNNQLLVTSRLIDIESYLNGIDMNFSHQYVISRNKYGKNFDEIRANNDFKKLIESYRKNGYNRESYLTFDKRLFLCDGNHRMGIHLYDKIEKISAKVYARKVSFPRGCDGFYAAGLHTDFIEELFEKYNSIQRWLIENGFTFCAFLPFATDKIDLSKDIRHLTIVLKEYELKKGKCVQFRLQDPKYFISKGKLVSQRALEIEKILRDRVTENKDSIMISINCLEGKQLLSSLLYSE